MDKYLALMGGLLIGMALALGARERPGNWHAIRRASAEFRNAALLLAAGIAVAVSGWVDSPVASWFATAMLTVSLAASFAPTLVAWLRRLSA
jgi:hypothetical protein